MKHRAPSTSGPDEGVTKFHLHFVPGPAPQWSEIKTLNAWRTLLFRLGLTGRDPNRYSGLAYGNVSLRVPEAGRRSEFLISGTQTGGLPVLQAEHYTRVVDYELAANRVGAHGPIAPSSEALTHAAVYAADSNVGCVLHVHSPELWRQSARLGLPTVPADVAYGTPSMAYAIADAVSRGTFPVIAMAGHHDGIVSYGDTISDAGERLIAALARAIEA